MDSQNRSAKGDGEAVEIILHPVLSIWHIHKISIYDIVFLLFLFSFFNNLPSCDTIKKNPLFMLMLRECFGVFFVRVKRGFLAIQQLAEKPVDREEAQNKYNTHPQREKNRYEKATDESKLQNNQYEMYDEAENVAPARIQFVQVSRITGRQRKDNPWQRPGIGEKVIHVFEE